jgi:hydrogenase-4 component F
VTLVAIPLVPLVAAVISWLPRARRAAPAVTCAAAAVVFIASASAGLRVVHEGTVVAVSEWVACDGLSALVLALVALVGMTSALFSWGYLQGRAGEGHENRAAAYYINFNLFFFSLLAVPLLLQPAVVWIAVELTTLLSVFLVSFEGTHEALEAAWKYVVLTLIGALIALLGFLLLYWGLRGTGSADFTWARLVAAAPRMPPALVQAAFVLVLIGFGTKTGLFPLHTWLPDAHSQAPSPVCALLSGVETTVILYAILRLIPVASAVSSFAVGRWLIVSGLLSVGGAAFLLLQTRDYKRLFAYSTVEHMGIIAVAAGLGGVAAPYAAAYQILSHALSKSFCFFASGAALLSTHTREIGAVRGLIRTSPIAGSALLLGGLAISGAPPFAVFLSEFSILRAGIAREEYAAVFLLTLFIALAFFGIMSRVNRMVFGQAADEPAGTRLPVTCLVALVIAAIPMVALGAYVPAQLHALLRLAAVPLRR